MMKEQAMTNPVFKFAGRVRGNLQASFVFQNKREITKFLNSEFVELEAEYGKLTFEVEKLPGLKIGDHCFCHGEGRDVLKVEAIRQNGAFSWSFGLSHGCWEEVAKCWKKVKA
jgi:hypothetical protein